MESEGDWRSLPSTISAMPDRPPGPLANVRVIDLTDDRAIYAGKLLADLGADVSRIEPAAGDPLRRRAPFHENGASLWHAYFASSRSILSEEPQTVAQLARSADVILDCERLPNPDALFEANPGLVIVDVTSFGRTGPWKDFQAPGLVAEALGGVAATSGDADTPPLKLYGDQYAFVGGAYAAIGALAALSHARQTGQGQIVRLSTHEALGTILEHVLMWAWYHELVPFADGPVLHRQGSLHWSNAYVVMQAIGGSIMITPTPDFSRQVAWLVEEGLGLKLLDERFSDPANVAEMIQLTMQTLRDWVATKEVEPFFHDAQARHHPYGWVMTTPEVAANPQLEARDWWTPYPVGDATVTGPGAPYHFSDTPWMIDAFNTSARSEPEDATSSISPPAERGRCHEVTEGGPPPRHDWAAPPPARSRASASSTSPMSSPARSPPASWPTWAPTWSRSCPRPALRWPEVPRAPITPSGIATSACSSSTSPNRKPATSPDNWRCRPMW